MSAERLVPPRKPRTFRDSLRLALGWTALALLIAYAWAALSATKFNLYELAVGAPQAKRLLSELAHPDLGWVARDAQGQVLIDPRTEPTPEHPDRVSRPLPGTLRLLLEQMNVTVMVALLGTLLALGFSFLLAFPAARNLTGGSRLGRSAYWLARGVLNFLRAIDAVILGIIFMVIVGPGPFAGVLALALHSIGSLGKLFAEAIEQADPQPVEAVRATGASSFLTVWFGILPQVAPQLLAFCLYRWDLNIRAGIILGIVGAGGIGFYLTQYISLFQYGKAATALLIILVAVSLLDWASGYLREKIG